MAIGVSIILAIITVICLFVAVCCAYIAGRAKGFEDGYLFDERIKQHESEQKTKNDKQQQDTNK